MSNPGRHPQAIDLLDEAGSRARISAFNLRKQRQTSVLASSPADYWAEIRAVQKQQQSALVLANEPTVSSFFEEAPPPKAAIVAPAGPADMSELDEAVKRAGFSSFWEEEEDVVVGLEDIAAVASIWSGVPVQQLTTEESARLVNLEDTLRTRVIGQVGGQGLDDNCPSIRFEINYWKPCCCGTREFLDPGTHTTSASREDAL